MASMIGVGSSTVFINQATFRNTTLQSPGFGPNRISFPRHGKFTLSCSPTQDNEVEVKVKETAQEVQKATEKAVDSVKERFEADTEKTKANAESIGDKIQEAAAAAKKKTDAAVSDAQASFSEGQEKTKEGAGNLVESLQDAGEKTKQSVLDAGEKATQAVQDALGNLKK